MEESTGQQESTKADATGVPHTAESQRGPTWRGWVLSILAAIILSVTATLLLAGSGAFRSDRATGPAAGYGGHGAESGCCPPAGAGK
jgi:hypothetical protein